jgi:hypothetical protein
LASPHDALFRFTFGMTGHARSLLLFLLPPPLAHAIDWTSLREWPATTPSPCSSCWSTSRVASALRCFEGWSALVQAVAAAPGGRLELEALSSYFLHVTELPAGRLADWLARVVSLPDENAVMSTADKLRAEGLAQGRVEGRAEGKIEGRAEGRAEGRVELLLRLLTARFGKLPEPLPARLRNARPEDLDGWALRVLDAKSLAEVFGPE